MLVLQNQAEFDAQLVHKACSSILGTDEKALCEVFCTRTPREIQEIRKAYKRLYDKDMLKVVADDVSGTFKTVLVFLITQQPDDEPNQHEFDGLDEDLTVLHDAAEACVHIRNAAIARLRKNRCPLPAALRPTRTHGSTHTCRNPTPFVVCRARWRTKGHLRADFAPPAALTGTSCTMSMLCGTNRTSTT